MNTVVQVDDLQKSYGAKHAVRNVGFAVRQGEIFGILGPNGAGKTTTVETLAGLRHADGGSVAVLGIDPQREPARVREILGVQLQESRLPARITVTEALHLYASFYSSPADPAELVTTLGLHEHRRTRFAKLSGGLQQRLSIALALIGNPRVAILDELTTGLDPQARRAVWDVVEGVRNSEVTILLVTHFMDEAERLCDRLVIIDEGQVVAAGAPGELIRGDEDERAFRMRLPVPLNRVRHRLENLTQVRSLTTVGEEVEIRGGAHALPDAILSLSEADVVPDEIRTLNRSLEDVFVEVTGRSPEPLEATA